MPVGNPRQRECFNPHVGVLAAAVSNQRCLAVTKSQFHLSTERTNVNWIERNRNLSAMAFHEKAGRSQGNFLFEVCSSCFSGDKVISPAELAIVAMLPSALSRSDWFRSVHVGRSQFSRCCHLISDLSFTHE